METRSKTESKSQKKSRSNSQSSSGSPLAKPSSSKAPNRSTYGTNSKQPIGYSRASVLRSTDTAPESSSVHKYPSFRSKQSQPSETSRQPVINNPRSTKSRSKSTSHQYSYYDEPKLIRPIPSFRNPRNRDSKTSDEPSRMSQSSHGNHGNNARSTESWGPPPNGYRYVTDYAWGAPGEKPIKYYRLQKIQSRSKSG